MQMPPPDPDALAKRAQLIAGLAAIVPHDNVVADADGMRQLVAQLDRAVGPDRLLFSQNGDPIAQRVVEHLDGWNREDVTFTYDFATDGYVPVPAAGRREAVALLRRVRAEGVLVTTADYLPEVEPDLEAEAADRSCGAGAIPFVGDIELTRLPDQPLRCP